MNIPLSERIKNTSIKKASKPGNNIVKEDAPKLNLFQKENEKNHEIEELKKILLMDIKENQYINLIGVKTQENRENNKE